MCPREKASWIKVGERTNKAGNLERGNPIDCSSNMKGTMHRSDHIFPVPREIPHGSKLGYCQSFT